MSVPSAGWLVSVGLVAAAMGYFGRGLRTSEVVSLSYGQVPISEYFASAESFSEIENARSQLDGLCLRLLCQIRLLRRELQTSPHPIRGISHEDQQRALSVIEDGWNELQGTGRELLILPDYLHVLRESGRYQEWLDLYLTVAREQPGHSILGRFATDALKLADYTGRTSEVRVTLDWARSVPTFTPVRQQLDAALHAQEPPLPSGRSVAGPLGEDAVHSFDERG